ncbi:MAG: hypothetical protein ACO2Z3_06575, partial [Flavobacteriaceae bacterium]
NCCTELVLLIRDAEEISWRGRHTTINHNFLIHRLSSFPSSQDRTLVGGYPNKYPTPLISGYSTFFG